MSAASADAQLGEAVLRIGRLTLHESAAYAAILGVLALTLGLVSAHVTRRHEREALRALRRLLGRHR